jgi:hypothetical protein
VGFAPKVKLNANFGTTGWGEPKMMGQEGLHGYASAFVFDLILFLHALAALADEKLAMLPLRRVKRRHICHLKKKIGLTLAVASLTRESLPACTARRCVLWELTGPSSTRERLR